MGLPAQLTIGFYPIRTRVLSSLFYKFYHTSYVKKHIDVICFLSMRPLV